MKASEQKKEGELKKASKKERKPPQAAPNAQAHNKKGVDLSEFLTSIKPTTEKVAPAAVPLAIYRQPTQKRKKELPRDHILHSARPKPGGERVENPNPGSGERFVIRRGKERETPKKKKPTKLKKVILQDRTEKYVLLLNQQSEASSQKQHSTLSATAPEFIPSSALSPNAPVFVPSIVTTQADDTDINNQSNKLEEGGGVVDTFDKEDKVSEVNTCKDVDSVMEKSEADEKGDREVKEASLDGREENKMVMELPAKIPKIPNKSKHREYCTQIISDELNGTVTELLAELRRFQDRLKVTNPLKAKAKRRLMSGLREVSRALGRKKLKCVIVATNIDEVASPGGLDDMTRDIIKMCNSSGVPLVFALSRKKLGEAMGKVIRISVVGILDYSGAETLFNKMLTLAKAARKEWLQLNKDNKNNTKNSKQDEQHHNEGKENEQHHSDTKENEHAQQIEPHHSDTTENRHHYRDTQETEHDHKVILSNENTTLQIEVTPMEVKSETS